jgi:hypothetical protein
MATEVETDRASGMSSEPRLAPDFTARLEEALAGADRDRRRRALLQRVRAFLPLVLLVGPIVGWRLMLASPDGVHVGIDTLAWITAVLDVGVHIDASVLSYLGLQALPSIVGFLLFVLVTLTLLGHRGEKP